MGDKEVLAHPDGQSLSTVVTMVGGPLLFLIGTLVFRRLLEGRWIVPQIAGVLMLLAIAAASPMLAALGTGVATTVALLVVAALETVYRMRRRRRNGG